MLADRGGNRLAQFLVTSSVGIQSVSKVGRDIKLGVQIEVALPPAVYQCLELSVEQSDLRGQKRASALELRVTEGSIGIYRENANDQNTCLRESIGNEV